MRAKVALAVALSCAALAIAVVAVDTRYAVRAELQALEGTEYVTVADSRGQESTPKFVGCPGQDLRVVVHNDQPWRSTVRVRVEASGPGPEQLLLDERWDLARGEQRSVDVRVPDAVFTPEPGSGSTLKPTAWVTAHVGDDWLSTCVEAA